MTESRRPWQDAPEWNRKELAKLPLAERRDAINGARIADLEAKLEQTRAALERKDKALFHIRNMAHLAWTDKKTIRRAFEFIEDEARAAIEETK